MLRSKRRKNEALVVGTWVCNNPTQLSNQILQEKNTVEGLFFGGGILKLFASPLGLNKLRCFVSGMFFNVSIKSAGKVWSIRLGSTITNGREPRSCLGQVFNSKLDRIATLGSKCMVCIQPLLKLKTLPKARPVS